MSVRVEVGRGMGVGVAMAKGVAVGAGSDTTVGVRVGWSSAPLQAARSNARPNQARVKPTILVRMVG